MSYDLSILIPARNEIFVSNTVEDLLKNIRGNTEIIVALDGQWASPPIKDHDRVTIIYLPKPVGQRGAQNRCAKVSRAKYVMKVDAHCSFDEGFDVKMMSAMQDDWTMAPVMRNLHAYDWVCPNCKKRTYQDRPPTCPDCESEMEKDMLWRAKRSPNSTSYRVNSQLEFKYFGSYKKKQIGDIVDTMSLQGSCFMATRKNYWEKELCNESWGSWGGQGAEVALKTWLSGGRVVVNKTTWYAHMFRTKPGFSHPYPNPGREQQRAKDKLREIFLNDNWPKAKYKLRWLVEKFHPVPGWTPEDISKLSQL